MKIGWRRRLKYLPHRLRSGFWAYEIWSLDQTIARFVLPRLRYLKEVGCGYPGVLTAEEWDKILDEMIWAMDYTADDDKLYGNFGREDSARCQTGMELFGKYFNCLWD